MPDPTPAIPPAPVPENPVVKWGIPTAAWNAFAIALLGLVMAYMQSLTNDLISKNGKKADEDAKAASVEVKEVKAKAAEAAVEVKQVKKTLVASNTEQAEKIDDLTKTADSTARTADATHILVNSNMQAQMKISAIALRRVADLTKNADDIAAAELAEKNLRAHELKQDKVDGFPE